MQTTITNNNGTFKIDVLAVADWGNYGAKHVAYAIKGGNPLQPEVVNYRTVIAHESRKGYIEHSNLMVAGSAESAIARIEEC